MPRNSGRLYSADYFEERSRRGGPKRVHTRGRAGSEPKEAQHSIDTRGSQERENAGEINCRRKSAHDDYKASRGTREKPWKSSDTDSELRRSRSRERKRRKQQYTTMQRYQTEKEESRVFWDGFQWVAKTEKCEGYNQDMNSTRRARRLHVGNLPMEKGATEEELKQQIWRAMLSNKLCSSTASCPILHVWFARDRGATFGFVELDSVESAHAVLTLDSLTWMGSSIRINRPTDSQASIDDKAVESLACSSGLGTATAEALAAAAHQARLTGNSGGLVKLISNLPPEGQAAITHLLNSQATTENTRAAFKSVELIKGKIRNSLLGGAQSRIVRIHNIITGDGATEDPYTRIEAEIMRNGTVVSILRVTQRIKDCGVEADSGDVVVEYATLANAESCIMGLSGRFYNKEPLRVSRIEHSVWKEKMKPFATSIFLNQFDTKK